MIFNTKENLAKQKYQGDRFLINRTSTDMSLANYLISNNLPLVKDKKQIPTSILSKLIEETILEKYNSDSCSEESPKRTKSILNFSKKESKQKDIYNRLGYVYKKAEKYSKIKKIMRYISPSSEKILDAPDILNDYYLQLMSWNINNIIAIALNQTTYLYNNNNSKIQILYQELIPQNYISSVEWMSHPNFLAIGFSNNVIQLWDIENSKRIRSLTGHLSRISALSWNEQILSSGSKDCLILNHDIRLSNALISKLVGHNQEICGLKWSHDGLNLASGSNDNNLIVWDWKKMCTEKFRFAEHKSAIKALSWCPWQKGLLASGGGSNDKTIKFWNSDTGNLINSFFVESQISSLIWNPFEKELVSSHGFSKNQIVIWKYKKMKKICELKGHTNRILQMCEGPCGQMIVSAAADETIRFWRVFEGRKKDKIEEEDNIKMDRINLLR